MKAIAVARLGAAPLLLLHSATPVVVAGPPVLSNVVKVGGHEIVVLANATAPPKAAPQPESQARAPGSPEDLA